MLPANLGLQVGDFRFQLLLKVEGLGFTFLCLGPSHFQEAPGRGRGTLFSCAFWRGTATRSHWETSFTEDEAQLGMRDL